MILADEPVASLDPPTANMVMRDLQRINRELGITTIVNLHFLDLARRYADRIIGMRDGRDGLRRHRPTEADDAVFEEIYGRSPHRRRRPRRRPDATVALEAAAAAETVCAPARPRRATSREATRAAIQAAGALGDLGRPRRLRSAIHLAIARPRIRSAASA